MELRYYRDMFRRKTSLPVRRISGGCLVAALVVMIVHSVVAARQRHEMAALREAYLQTRKALAAPATKDLRHQGLVRAMDDLAAVEKRLFHVTELAGQMRELSEFIRQSGLSADRLSYGSKRITSLPLWRYEASFRVSGGYAPLKRLLAKIQSSPHLLCIERLAFSKAVGKEAGVSMNLTISTYLRGTRAPSAERVGG